MTGQEACDDEREALARVLNANFFYAADDPSVLELADAVLAAGYRKHPEPEWEYDYMVEGDWMAYPNMESLREDYGDTDRPILRRRKVGEWEQT